MEQLMQQQLLDKIRQSDHVAFELLHATYWHSLYKIAYSKIGDTADTNDLLQEMFIELWEKRETLSFSNSVENWLRNRLWFKVASYFRTRGFKQKHLESIRIFLEQEASIVAPSSIELKEGTHDFEEILDAVNTCIGEMPDRMRQIFDLNLYHELSVREISEKLQVAPTTVKTQLERAKQKLKKLAEIKQHTSFEYVFILWLINR